MDRTAELTAGTQIEIGRWAISERESTSGLTVNDCRGKSVARVPLRDDDLSIARLIAAAPELLDACARLLKWAPTHNGKDPYQQDAAFARAAIAKATS